MAKRMISLLLALIMTLALAVPALASEGTDPAAEKPQESQTEPQETADDPAEGPVEAEDTAPQGPIEGALAETVAEEPAPEEEEEQADAVYAPAPVSADNGIMLAAQDLKETLKQSLDESITEAERIKGLGEDNYKKKYTDTSRQTLEETLAEAKEMKTKADDPEQLKLLETSEMSSMIEKLQKAYHERAKGEDYGLDPFATLEEWGELDKQLKLAKNFTDEADYKNNYLEDSRTTLSGAVEKGTPLQEKGEEAQHKEVVEAIEALKAAIAGMKKNQVTASIVRSGYYADKEQAKEALKALNNDQDAGFDACENYEMYVQIQQPDTGNDVHNYCLKVTGGSKTLVKDKLVFSGNACQENKLLVFWKPSELGFEGEKLENGTTITATLYAYNKDDVYKEGVTKLTEAGKATIKVDTSYEGPRFLKGGWSKNGEEPENSKNVMYVTLDTEKNMGTGIKLELVDKSGKKYTIQKDGTAKITSGKQFCWTWDAEPGSALKAPGGCELKAGEYTVNLYAYTESADGSINPGSEPVDSVKITVPAIDVKELQAQYDKVPEDLDDEHYVTMDKVQAAVEAAQAAKEVLDSAASTPQTKENQADVDAKKSALESALDPGTLKKRADYTALDKAIADAEAIVGASTASITYVKEELNAVVTALEQARGVDRDLDKSKQESDIDPKTEALTDALAKLSVADADWDAFDKEVTAAKAKQSDGTTYTSKTKNALDSAIKAAEAFKEANKSLKATGQAQVNAETEKLTKAVAGLITAADLTELKAALAEAKKLKASDYIDFSAMKKAISDAETFINSDPDVSQNDKAATLKDALDKAKAGLAALKYKDQVTGNGGWKKEEGVWRYYQKGSAQPLKDSWLKSGSKWYFLAAGTGNMVTGWQFIDGQYYHFAKSGVMEKLSGWKKINGGWYWFTKNDMRAGSWLKTGGKWYYLGDNGRMLTGLQVIDGKTYYLKSSGAMATGWKKIDGKWYRFGSSGAMLKAQWAKVSGKWYYLDANGVMVTGKQVIGGKTYYLKSSGAMLTGWKKISGHWEYYDKSGIMVKSKWVKSSGKWYYLNADGVMLTGLQEIEGKTYYLKSSGAMLTGWKKIDGKWYRFNSSGAMVKSKWAKVSGKWYYMNASGVMLTGLQAIDGETYYLKSSGAMATGWKKISGKWYWFSSSGIMAKSKWVKSSGKWYYLDADGVMLTGWLEQDGKKYYLDSSGVMVTGSRIIDRKVYLFNSKGEMLKNGWQKVGMLKYYLREDGSAYADEWLKISGKWYYFLGDGSMAMNMWIDKKYWVGADGVWVK